MSEPLLTESIKTPCTTAIRGRIFPMAGIKWKLQAAIKGIDAEISEMSCHPTDRYIQRLAYRDALLDVLEAMTTKEMPERWQQWEENQGGNHGYAINDDPEERLIEQLRIVIRKLREWYRIEHGIRISRAQFDANTEEMCEGKL